MIASNSFWSQVEEATGHFFYPLVKMRFHISLLFFFITYFFYTYTLQQAVNWPVAISFTVWHLALYIFDRAYDFELDGYNQPNEAVKQSARSTWLAIAYILSVLPLPILYFSKLQVLPYIPFIPLTFLYCLRVYKRWRIKSIPFIKNFYSAFFIWTLPLLTIAYCYEDGYEHSTSRLYEQLWGLFLYVLAGEAYWDIRDIKGDKADGVYTIPVLLGEQLTKLYILFLILADASLHSWSFGFSFWIYLFLLATTDQNSPRWVFHLPPLLAVIRFVMDIIPL